VKEGRIEIVLPLSVVSLFNHASHYLGGC